MKYYNVYFEIFGKKMKVKVLAENANIAKQMVKDKIIFHKVCEDQDDEFNKILDTFNKIIK